MTSLCSCEPLFKSTHEALWWFYKVIGVGAPYTCDYQVPPCSWWCCLHLEHFPLLTSLMHFNLIFVYYTTDTTQHNIQTYARATSLKIQPFLLTNLAKSFLHFIVLSRKLEPLPHFPTANFRLVMFHYIFHSTKNRLGKNALEREVCLFGVFHSTREFFTHMETSSLPVKGCKFWPILGTHDHKAVTVL